MSPVTTAQLAGWVEREHSLETQAWRWPAAWREILAARQAARRHAPWAAWQVEQAVRRAAAKRARKAKRRAQRVPLGS